jgi:arylsulfatase A-like enzyme
MERTFLSGIKKEVIYCLQFLLLFIGGNCLSACTKGAQKVALIDPPNIIFILSDDLGSGDLSCYGHPYAQTPNIDQLAHTGLQLKRCYALGVTCAPSRAAFMTGRFPATLAGSSVANGFDQYPTLTEILQQNGYQTGHVGKWHMGNKQQLGSQPYGIEYINKQLRIPEVGAGKDDSLFAAAIDFIKRAKGKPFYLNIWSHAIHFPISTGSKFEILFDTIKVNEHDFSQWYLDNKIRPIRQAGLDLDSLMKQYLAEVYELDHHIGEIMQYLEANNLSENTIIVFSSDHGPAPIDLTIQESEDRKKQRYSLLGASGDFKGGKHTFEEGGVRIPFIIRWPAKIPVGTVDSSTVFSAVDFMPTLCGIIGLPTKEFQLSGEDMQASWLGKVQKRTHPLFWKTQAAGSSVTILDGDWKLYENLDSVETLYNLKSDPTENNNIAKAHPEIVRELRQKIDKWKAALPN